MRQRERVVGGRAPNRMTLLGAVLGPVLLAGGLVLLLDAAKKGSEEVSAEEASPEDFQQGVFIRPGLLAPGGTYEVHLDAKDAHFSELTTLETDSAGVAVLSLKIRHERGLTMELGVSAEQADGSVELEATTLLSDGTTEVVKASVYIDSSGTPGPALTFLNLPPDERVVAEGGFAHFRLSVEGSGPFLVEFGLRSRGHWCSRVWNEPERNHADRQGLVVEGPEVASFEVPLPDALNIVDVVAIDRNGFETCVSLVVESRAPLDMENLQEARLLEGLFKKEGSFIEDLFEKKEAWATCSNDPTFSFYTSGCSGRGGGQCMDTDGTDPLEFECSADQGVVCGNCCDGDSPLSGVAGGAGGGGYEGRPDGYSTPTSMPRNYGKVFPHSGEFKTTVTDLSIPVPGLEFAVRRTYRSQVSYHSRLGRSWDTNLQSRYLRYGTITGTSATVTGDLYFYGGDGRRDQYVHVSGVDFDSPPGFYDEFRFDSSSLSQEILNKDGSRKVFTETQVGDDVVYGKLSRIYGRRSTNYLDFTYDLNGKLTGIESSAGPRLVLSYDGDGYLTRIYQSGTGLDPYEVNYVQNANGALVDVTYSKADFYQYNGDDLEVVPSPDDRKKVSYTYDEVSSGDLLFNLEEITDGRGNLLGYPMVSLAYDANDRVLDYTTDPAGIGTTRRSFHFTYTLDAEGFPVTTAYDLEDDAGNTLRTFTLDFGASGGVTRKVIQTGGGVLLGEWNYERGCECNLATKIRDPLGRIETREYDTHGNLVKRILHFERDTDCSDGCFNELAPDPDTRDIVYLYDYQLPNYESNFQYGKILERATPNIVDAHATGHDITSIDDWRKTQYVYDSAGDLRTMKSAQFTDHTDFGGGAHRGTVKFTYYGTSDPDGLPGQLEAREVRLDDIDPADGTLIASRSLRTTRYTYYVQGVREGLVATITEDPSGLALTKSYDYDERRDLTNKLHGPEPEPDDLRLHQRPAALAGRPSGRCG